MGARMTATICRKETMKYEKELLRRRIIMKMSKEREKEMFEMRMREKAKNMETGDGVKKSSKKPSKLRAR